MTRITLCLITLGVVLNTNAAEPEGGDGRSPGDLSVEERYEMMRRANDYNTCVYNRATTRLDDDPDIRRVADLAMDDCQDTLDGLNDAILNWGYPGYFAEGFTRTVRDRAARKLLPELAIRKSR